MVGMYIGEQIQSILLTNLQTMMQASKETIEKSITTFFTSLTTECKVFIGPSLYKNK